MAKRPFGKHYALTVLGIVFVALLAAAGLRATPAVLMVPWGQAFGWSRATISFAAATGIFLFGMTGPFAAALMQRFGIRAVVLAALALMSASTGLSLFMTQAWQLVLLWGVLSGLGSGCVAQVLSASIVNRWFVTRRGLAMGLLAASTSTGTLIFFPLFSAIAQAHGWQGVVMMVSIALALLILPVALFLPEWPSDVGETPFGAPTDHVVVTPSRGNPLAATFAALREGLQNRDFWLLAGTFFVCGFTTNGLVGTHMIALCGDHGMDAVAAGSLLAMMGLFDLVGTTMSGWLTDRYDPRKLLFAYYGLRGLSLFTVFYGLDWIATVPPTLALTNKAFGSQKAPIIFGWIAASHQIGAATAAFLAGATRTATGSYLDAFVVAGFVGVAAALMALGIGRRPNSVQAA